MICGAGAEEGAFTGLLRTATSGVVAGLEISCGVAILSSFEMIMKRVGK
jgi:hypothetical protein